MLQQHTSSGLGGVMGNPALAPSVPHALQRRGHGGAAGRPLGHRLQYRADHAGARR